MYRLALMAALVGLASSAGCLMRTMDLPPDFIKVDKANQGAFAVRGVSADGVVVGLRTEHNPEGGTLNFWTEAITTEMAKDRGYKIAGTEDVKSDGGTAGKLLRFSTERQGATFTYLVAVFVQGTDILIAEGGGKADIVEPKMAAIRKALLSVR